MQCGAAQRAAVWINAVSLDAVSLCMMSVSAFVNVSLASFVCVSVWVGVRVHVVMCLSVCLSVSVRSCLCVCLCVSLEFVLPFFKPNSLLKNLQ